jgi:O-acetylhomoserine (thiol)-lyase
MKFETLCLHGGTGPDPVTGSCALPVYRTSAFVFENTEKAARAFTLQEPAHIYSRFGNPTVEALERRMALLEGGAGALALSSGSAAAFYTVINCAQAGDHFIAANNLYGGTTTQFAEVLPRLGITCTFVDPKDPENFRRAITPKTRLIFCETISNPTLEFTDIEAVAKIAHENGLPLAVDATFSTPYLQRPIDFGADLVIHSLTKWIGGHGTGLGGIVVDAGRFDWTSGRHPLFTEPDGSFDNIRWGLDLPEHLAHAPFIVRMRNVPLRTLGSSLSPDNAWLFLQGLETLPLRMDRHCENAARVAQALEANPRVAWVRHPTLASHPQHHFLKKYARGKGCGVVTFGIRGGKAAGGRFIESLRLFSHLANVGDAKSLAIHPATTTHAQLNPDQKGDCGISPELVRLSVGIENIDDILADLEQALAASE